MSMENLDPLRQKPDFEKIADLIRNGITFSGQVGDYVIHGAIESILEDRDKFAIGFARFCQVDLRGRTFEDLMNEFKESLLNQKP